MVLLFTKGLISLKNEKCEFNFILRGKHLYDENSSIAFQNKLKLLGNWFKTQITIDCFNNGARRFPQGQLKWTLTFLVEVRVASISSRNIKMRKKSSRTVVGLDLVSVLSIESVLCENRFFAFTNKRTDIFRLRIVHLSSCW